MALKRLATETIITSKGGTGRVEPGQGAGIKAEEGMHISQGDGAEKEGEGRPL